MTSWTCIVTQLISTVAGVIASSDATLISKYNE